MPCRSVWGQLSHSCWIKTKYQSFSLRFPPWCHLVLKHRHLDRLFTFINTKKKKKKNFTYYMMCRWNAICFTSSLVLFVFCTSYCSLHSLVWKLILLWSKKNPRRPLRSLLLPRRSWSKWLYVLKYQVLWHAFRCEGIWENLMVKFDMFEILIPSWTPISSSFQIWFHYFHNLFMSKI